MNKNKIKRGLIIVLVAFSATFQILSKGVYATTKDTDNLKTWGIEGTVSSWVSNNKNYDWYIDQMNTGKYGSINCGPSVATMAANWSNKSLHNTGEEARNIYQADGGWWNTDNVKEYLSFYKIPCTITKVYDTDIKNQIKFMIDKGDICIFCIDSTYLDYNSNKSQREGLYYRPSNGHFILVKGYIETDNTFYVEAYDPYNDYKFNDDGTPKGENRYYDIKYLSKAIFNKWNYTIDVSPVNNQ